LSTISRQHVAAAMAALVAAAALVVCILYLGIARLVERRTHAWRNAQ
jgi:hypothetical protein